MAGWVSEAQSAVRQIPEESRGGRRRCGEAKRRHEATQDLGEQAGGQPNTCMQASCYEREASETQQNPAGSVQAC